LGAKIEIEMYIESLATGRKFERFRTPSIPYAKNWSWGDGGAMVDRLSKLLHWAH
jgi:hypothetical protein